MAPFVLGIEAVSTLNLADYDVRQNVIQTQQIQKIFDEADRLGGLTVVFPRGTYFTGTIDIKSASVYLEKGSVWKESGNLEDYYPNGFAHNEMHQTTCLIYSMHYNDISISGSGTIDLNGDAFYDLKDPNLPDYGVELSEEQIAECPRKIGGRPSQPIFFLQCQNIVMDGITKGVQPTKRFDISIRDIRISNVSCISENAIAVIGENGCVEDICFDGVYFEKKDSANRYLKGDRRIDVNPSKNIYDMPEGGEYWFFEHGGKNVTYKNVNIKPYHGIALQAISMADD